MNAVKKDFMSFNRRNRCIQGSKNQIINFSGIKPYPQAYNHKAP